MEKLKAIGILRSNVPKTCKLVDGSYKGGYADWECDMGKAISEAVHALNKRFLMELLDKNLLYVNYCDIEDAEFAISDEDKSFTRSFYKEG